MNFFEEQEVARRKTARLVVLFALAVLGLVLGINTAVAAVLFSQGGGGHPLVFVGVTLGVLLVIGLGSLYRIASLRGGGRVVAEMLGGRRLDAGLVQAEERVLLNVVEEMAIASGTPVPAVYVLEEEGINAFAAGFDPGDAVIGVTRGALEQLSRDELQGVVAHEFSHVFNGDMRLNIRLMGVLHGILLLGLIGEGILRSVGRASGGRRSRRGGGGGGQILVVILASAAVLLVFGYLGTFFGNLIKAAASRQREFLADASAVQFTRNPLGIGGALLKIAGHPRGARLAHPSAPAASHFYFGEGVASHMGRLGSTHPPLEERIVRILPALRGRLPKASAKRDMALLHGEIAGLAAAASAPAEAPPAASALEQVGNVTQAHVRRARELIADLPERLRNAVREPYSARAVVYALLLDPRGAVEAAQLAALRRTAAPDIARELDALAPAVRALPVEARLPLVELAMPALAQLSPEQHVAFARDLEALVQADGQVTLMELALQRMVQRHLAPLHDRQAARRAAREKKGSLARSLPAAALVLSQLARTGADDESGAARAFAVAWQRMGLSSQTLLPAKSSRGAALGDAVDELAVLAPYGRRAFLTAAAAAITADQEVRPQEAETFRLLAEALDVPVPPLLPHQRLGPAPAARP